MFNLTICNLTDYPITALAPSAPDKAQAHNVLQPRLDFATVFGKRFCKEVVLQDEREVGLKYHVGISMPPGAIWRSVTVVPEDCPWRIYIVQVCVVSKLKALIDGT